MWWPRRLVVRCAFLLAVSWLFTGCGGAGPESLRVKVDIDPNANQNSPIAFAVLVVYDETMQKELRKLTAREWFEQSEQRLRDNPEMTSFDVLLREWMPGQIIKEITMPLAGKPGEGLVFADYYSEGDHRSGFNPERGILIILGEEDFNVLVVADEQEVWEE